MEVAKSNRKKPEHSIVQDRNDIRVVFPFISPSPHPLRKGSAAITHYFGSLDLGCLLLAFGSFFALF